MRVSSECKSLEVHSDAYHAAKFGPFDRDVFPTELEAVLTDLRLVRGLVTHDGLPVAGARIELLAKGLDAAEGIPSGLFYGYDGFRALTNSAGAFATGSDFPHMPYYARACADGLAVGIAGPVRVGDPPLVVELSNGGTIEGTLRLQSAGNGSGKHILLYRDDYEPESKSECGRSITTADAEGRFRFEHVAAGDWLVKLAPTSKRPEDREQEPVEFVPFVVSVRDNETTHLDMNLAGPVAHLEGDLRLNGRPWSRAYVCLRVIGDRAFIIDTVPGSNDGKWSVRARTPGKYRLVVRGDHQHSGEPREVSEIVELSREGSRWKRAVTWRHGDPEPPRLQTRN